MYHFSKKKLNKNDNLDAHNIKPNLTNRTYKSICLLNEDDWQSNRNI